MKILLTGGGTMGSVSPLIAVKEELSFEPDVQFLFIGTKRGPEKQIVEQNKINFKSIPSGKLRRYFDWRNFTDLVLIFVGFLKSLWLIVRFNPEIVLTAGSFVCVPVAYAARILGKRVLVHQQDLKIGLANRLMVPVASKITVALPELREKFPREKVVVTGNPTRKVVFSGNIERAKQYFKLENNVPTLLIVGGGVGSEIINGLFIDKNKELTKFCQVIHVVGKGEQSKWLNNIELKNNHRYHAYEFLGRELSDAYVVANIVFGRAGFSTLTELSALSKPAIIMPIPDNQQEDNAEYFYKKQAIVYVRQEDFDPEYVIGMIESLLLKRDQLLGLGENINNAMPQDAREEYAKLVKELVGRY